MDIRSDLRQEAQLLSRLANFAGVFRKFNIEDWSHLKNEEDFERIYSFPWPQRGPLENIYADGRDIAVFMSGRLQEFNDPSVFPTLKSFVDSFSGGWVDQVHVLVDQLAKAREVAATVKSPPWAVGQMLGLFSKQIELLEAVRGVLNQLQGSDTYLWESRKTKAVIQSAPYDQVLGCIDAVGKMFERLPGTYAGMGEEQLRDHILVSLSAAVTGSATGETFNKRGKTDILVRSPSGSNNEFVGECKFWRGEVVYHATIDQLLSYLGWRDDKTAVILFVPSQGFSAVLEKIKEFTPKHPAFSRFVSEGGESWFNYEFRLPAEPSRLIRLAVMAYHLH